MNKKHSLVCTLLWWLLASTQFSAGAGFSVGSSFTAGDSLSLFPVSSFLPVVKTLSGLSSQKPAGASEAEDSQASDKVVILLKDDGFSLFTHASGFFTWDGQCHVKTGSDTHHSLHCNDPDTLQKGLRATVWFGHSGKAVQIHAFPLSFELNLTGDTGLAVAAFKPGTEPDINCEHQMYTIWQFLEQQNKRSDDIHRTARHWKEATLSLSQPRKPEAVLQQEQKKAQEKKTHNESMRLHYSVTPHRHTVADDTTRFTFEYTMENGKLVLSPSSARGFHKPVSLPSNGIVNLSPRQKRPATSAATDQPPTKKKAKERRNNKTEQKQPGVNSNAQPPPTVTIKHEKEEPTQMGKRRTKDDAPLFVVHEASGINEARLTQESFSLNSGVRIEIKEDENNWLSFKKEEQILIEQRIKRYLAKTNKDRQEYIDRWVKPVRYEAKENDPYPALNAQNHVVAHRNIPRGTVLGHYRGSIWPCVQSAPSPQYGMIDQQMSYAVECSNESQCADESQCEERKECEEKEEFWISGFDEGNIFSCINDSSFTDPSLPESIPLPENTGFVVVFIDNYPVVMIVTKQAIQKDEELWLNYGEAYWEYNRHPS